MPLDTILCVDTSGSMAGRGMRELKEACRTFVAGVRETSRQTGLCENVAIVEFGKQVRLVSALGHDYDAVERAVNTLTAGGRTPMKQGLLKAMEEIIQRGGVVTVRDRQKLAPRVILMTDGVPTDEGGETPEARQAVLDQAIAFGEKWRECGLPHGIPVACVGCGDCEPELLEIIATSTNGMFVIVDDVTKLSTFFRRQVLLTRFALQSRNNQAMKSQEALRAFLVGLGEAVEEAELNGLFRLLIGMMVLECMAEDSSQERDEIVAGLPPHGARVCRGRHWKWGNQDHHATGTVISHDRPGVVRVLWDTSSKSNIYRYGAEDSFDLEVLSENQPRVLQNGERGVSGHELKTGVEVRRGPDWRWGNQDGGEANTGIVYHVSEAEKSVFVRWSNGTRGKYRNGQDDHYDVVITPRSAGQMFSTTPHVANSGYQQLGSTRLAATAPENSLPAYGNVVADIPVRDGSRDGGVAQVPHEARSAVITGVTADDFIGFGIGTHSWQWQDPVANQWHLFPDKHSVLLEESRIQEKLQLVADEITYLISFKDMTRTAHTGPVQKIRRVSLSNSDRELAEAMERSLYLK
eukprot:scpid49524/ scgid18522/ E3 ubiquitin-protein ligase MIB2; Mind bomb homolog 2